MATESEQEVIEKLSNYGSSVKNISETYLEAGLGAREMSTVLRRIADGLNDVYLAGFVVTVISDALARSGIKPPDPSPE